MELDLFSISISFFVKYVLLKFLVYSWNLWFENLSCKFFGSKFQVYSKMFRTSVMCEIEVNLKSINLSLRPKKFKLQ